MFGVSSRALAAKARKSDVSSQPAKRENASSMPLREQQVEPGDSKYHIRSSPSIHSCLEVGMCEREKRPRWLGPSSIYQALERKK